jgi:hypothetical protein
MWPQADINGTKGGAGGIIGGEAWQLSARNGGSTYTFQTLLITGTSALSSLGR